MTSVARCPQKLHWTPPPSDGQSRVETSSLAHLHGSMAWLVMRSGSASRQVARRRWQRMRSAFLAALSPGERIAFHQDLHSRGSRKESAHQRCHYLAGGAQVMAQRLALGTEAVKHQASHKIRKRSRQQIARSQSDHCQIPTLWIRKRLILYGMSWTT